MPRSALSWSSIFISNDIKRSKIVKPRLEPEASLGWSLFCNWAPGTSTSTGTESIKTDSILTVSELPLIWMWSKPQARSKQGSRPYQNQNQDANPQSETCSVLQGPKWGLKGHWCSLHLQNQGREPKFGSWVYKKAVTISKSKSRCQPPVKKLQNPPKPRMRT